MFKLLIFNKNILLLFALICLLSFAHAQERIVEGTVVDKTTFEPLIGVNVLLKDSNIGTTTDIDGKYSISLPDAEADLIFSYLGYLQQEIRVGEINLIDVQLQPDAQNLEEVVVTAFGIKRQKRALGYSTEKVGGEEIALSNAPNVVHALSGKAAGVNVIAPNGVDGGTTRIVIRGNNNINGNNQPLIIVDGVPLENAPGLTDIGRGVDWGSAINNINPFDIESMDILKGPTAAALYGSRGANGVVLITTKRGRRQKGIGIDYTFNYKVIQAYRFREVQNVFGAGGPNTFTEPDFLRDATGNLLYPDGRHIPDGPNGQSTSSQFGFYSTGVSWGPKMEGQLIQWWDGELRTFDPQPDNLKLFFSDGFTATHNLAFSGGGKMGTMRASLTRTDHHAVIPNSTYNQSNVNLGAQLNISSKIKADISTTYLNYFRNNSPTLGDDNNNSFGKGILYSWPRSYKGLERELNTLPDGSRNEYDGKYPFTFTPPYLWWNVKNNKTTLDRHKLIGALTLTYEVTPWLNVLGRTGIDFTLNQFETRNNPINALGVLDGFYSNNLSRDIVRNSDFMITAHKEAFLGSKINAQLAFGGTKWQRRQYGIRAETGTWVDPWLFSFTNFGDPDTRQLPREARFEKDINSLYGFLNLNYDNFLFLELTGRNDWSSALPIDNNSYFYPSASLSFIATEALKWKKNWLSFLKLRAAIAKTATDTDPYQLDFVYSTGVFGGQQTASLPTTIPPIALQPQQANSYEAGLSLGFFRDKINLDLTYYYIKSFDQILSSPLPQSSGSGTIKINTGELENKGVELVLNARLINKRNFYLETGLNLARNRNFVVSLGDGADVLEIAHIWGLNGPAIAVRAGEEYGTIIGYDFIYDENSGRPILNDNGTHYLITERRVPIGNASPDWTGGWTLGMGFKGLTLKTLVNGSWGGDIYAGSYVIGLQTGQSPETLHERMGNGLPYTDPDGVTRNVGVVLDGVYTDGTPNDKVVHYYYKYLPNAGGWGKYPSVPGILENNWLKLRELSLAYQFPSQLLQKVKIFQNLNVALVGRDLLFLYASLPDNVNPEGANGSGNAQGLEWASYPSMRSFGISVNASF